MPRTGFDYHLETFPHPGLAELRPFFDRCPLDPYITGKFRRRRYSHFIGGADRLRRLDHQSFLQDKQVNYLAGGIRREFQELEDGLIAHAAFRAIVRAFIGWIDFDAEAREFGVHQIRIVCSPDFHGDPAPEGVHQDGFDYVGIFCVERHNVVGANTLLYREADGHPVFTRALQSGEAVFTDDRAIFHYTDPVRPEGPGDGHRDVFVITT
jgi:hypothetical protein